MEVAELSSSAERADTASRFASKPDRACRVDSMILPSVVTLSPLPDLAVRHVYALVHRGGQRPAVTDNLAVERVIVCPTFLVAKRGASPAEPHRVQGLGPHAGTPGLMVTGATPAGAVLAGLRCHNISSQACVAGSGSGAPLAAGASGEVAVFPTTRRVGRGRVGSDARILTK